MSIHRAEQIIDAIVARLQASTTLGINPENVFAHRTLSLAENHGEIPAATVNKGRGDPMSEFGTDNVAFVDSIFLAKVKTFTFGTDEPDVKRLLFNQWRYVWVALMADESLGLPFVIGVSYAGEDEMEFDSAGELIAGSMESHWRVHYRMNKSDPGD